MVYSRPVHNHRKIYYHNQLFYTVHDGINIVHFRCATWLLDVSSFNPIGNPKLRIHGHKHCAGFYIRGVYTKSFFLCGHLYLYSNRPCRSRRCFLVCLCNKNFQLLKHQPVFIWRNRCFLRRLHSHIDWNCRYCSLVFILDII